MLKLSKKQGVSVKMTNKKNAAIIIQKLEEIYPIADCGLRYENPYHLLVAVRLSAQCTDKRVNMVTPTLFARYTTPQEMRCADFEELCNIVKSTGFFRAKAKDLILCAARLCDSFKGQVPDNMDDLLSLAGVGRKSANLIMGDVYGKPAIVADTHCIRLSNRLGLAQSRNPLQVEISLKKLIDPVKSNDFCHRLVLHGRAVCVARNPRCYSCTIKNHCKFGKTVIV